MSYFLHPNQLPGLLAEQDEYDDNIDVRSISHALRFLEGIDLEDEPLRIRRRRRAERLQSLFFFDKTVHKLQ